MVNGTGQTDTDQSEIGQRRSRKSGPLKKVVLLIIWLALLGGLIFWIKTAGNPNGSAPIPGFTPPPQPAPKMDPAVMESRWPSIVAHAAAPPRGAAAAPYTLAEFGDFQCPQCGKVYPILETLLKKYPGQINLLFLHRPFPQLHPWALSAGQASEIAGAQGKFWPMYDVLYTNQDNLETGYYGGYAAKAGLNEAAFKKEFDAGQGQSEMKAATAFADSLNVQETPTLLLRDNTAKTVTIYVGRIGTKNADGSPQYPGVDTLAAHPPWAGK